MDRVAVSATGHELVRDTPRVLPALVLGYRTSFSLHPLREKRGKRFNEVVIVQGRFNEGCRGRRARPGLARMELTPTS
jgi:hypothetical protein